MPKSLPSRASGQQMTTLSRLLLPPCNGHGPVGAAWETPLNEISREEFEDLLELADLNHVTMRGMTAFQQIMLEAGDEMRAAWAADALAGEHARIQNATMFLHVVCSAFGEEGRDVTVMKSLDHWPDLGSDLDLFTSAPPEDVIQMMKTRFRATLAPRSWGDRLARKWNFLLPGLAEPIEIHMGRLGQTGEQFSIAASLPRRARTLNIDGFEFRVPSASDRLMVSTLQRMYRHFFFRLCDVVDTAALADSGQIDYDDLCSSARVAGIWEGVATYLMIVSDYAKKYRGSGLRLPRFVEAAARFGGSEIYYRQSFLRVPIMPQSAGLYGLQLTGLLRRRELQSSARLGLLPWLATAAMVGQKITGSDKGVW